MASAESANNAVSGLTPAELLAQKHAPNNPTIEDIPDEADLKHPVAPVSTSVLEDMDASASAPQWGTGMSAKAAGKQREDPSRKKASPLLDTQSEELFPGLGGGPKPSQPAASAPIWGAKRAAPSNGVHNTVSSNGSSTPASSIDTPQLPNQPISKGAPQSLAGQAPTAVYMLQPQELLSRKELKKPIPDILKDINKRTRANLSMTTGEGGVLKFSASGAVSDSVKHQAFRDLGSQIGAKSSVKIPVPRSSRAYIIGKGGSTIQSLQQATGARIQMPKAEDTPAGDDDEDDVFVLCEGNAFALALAKASINKIASERSAAVNTKLRNIPAEFYPFLTGPASELEGSHGVQIRVPPHHKWTNQAPPVSVRGQPLVFLPAAGDNHITLAGDRAAIQKARAEIEQIVQDLRQQLVVEQAFIERGRHKYILGERGVSPEVFFSNTGCAIILPGDDETEEITIVGRSPEAIDAAKDEARNLASRWQSMAMDVSQRHRNAPGGSRLHARNITQYLIDRKEIDRIKSAHQTDIDTPLDPERAGSWSIYYTDGKQSMKAQEEIASVFNAHPPSRMATVPVDPFFHAYIKNRISQRVRKDHGVHVVVPTSAEPTGPVLLVFEGGDSPSDYQVPRGQPSAAEVKAFKQGLDDANKHITDILNAHLPLSETEIDVPKIFHEKLRRFIQREQQKLPEDQIPVRVFPKPQSTSILIRGPTASVESLATKVNSFVAEAIEDEKERGFTLSFDFPQKHANQLIGKGGSNIRDLRDKFDVEIKVDDGKVELKGPSAKAEAAKAHISALGRQWADETTYTLKVEPKFHGELIGAQGAQINRLQTRYNVQIHFPRSQKPARDDQSNIDAASDAGRKSGRREQEPDEVVVKGPKKGADGAREEILSLLQYAKDTSHSAVVAVQPSQVPSLIGQRGRGMDEIRQSTNARIDIPNARDSLEGPTSRVEIQIRGTKDEVARAKKLIEQKRDVFDQTVKKTLEVDKKHHRALIGPGGSALRSIVTNAGGSDDPREQARTVQFPKADADGNLITVEGKGDLVDKIIAAMQAIVNERDSQTTETLDVSIDKHRSLIGRGGDTKKDLESKFKVSIDIPRQGSGQTAVKIAGLPANVEKAKVHILDLVKEQEGETVQVPNKIHHSIAENGQFFRRMRNDYQITIDHAGQKPPRKPSAPSNIRANGDALPLITDDENAASKEPIWNVVDTSTSDLDGEIPWVLRGPPDNLAKAKMTLRTAIEQALKNTTTGYLVLPDPGTYRHVIGQGGSKVNSIRKASGCKINVPQKQDKAEAIEILGTAEGVEKAKELILKAVDEGRNGNPGGNGRGFGDGFGGAEGSNGNGNWD